MKTEEAIESVKMAYCAWESEQKDMYEVIELLQQGEKYKKEYVEREAELYLIIKRTRKYKKMWRELHKVFGNYWNAFDVRKANNRDCDYKYVNELMEEVEHWNAFDVRKANNRDCDYKYVNELMEEVEQKYFPKI